MRRGGITGYKMNLTQRIVGAMALGLAVGGILNVLIPAGVLPETLAQRLSYYLIDGLFDLSLIHI